MKTTMEEVVRYYLLKMGKKGPVRRRIAIIGMYFCVSLFHFAHYIRDNRKRLAMVMMSLVIFIAYASFSFPIFPDGEEHKQNERLTALISDESVSLAPEAEVDLEGLEDWEEELLFEEDEAALLQEDEEDQIVLEDILTYRREQEERQDAVPESVGEQNREVFSFSSDDWRLILVNKQHPIPEDYDFTWPPSRAASSVTSGLLMICWP